MTCGEREKLIGKAINTPTIRMAKNYYKNCIDATTIEMAKIKILKINYIFY